MGRTQLKKKLARKSQPVAAAAPSGPSISALLEKAQSLIVQCDYELAQRFITRILEKEPSNIIAKEMLGVTQLETGDIDAARATFASFLDGPHPPPPSAHLYLAQLCEDDAQLALNHYQAAIEILTVQLKGKERAQGLPQDDDEEEIKSQIVGAFIGQVETWMDPRYELCDKPEAPEMCESLLQNALQVYPGNSEALQTLASVRISQERPEEAKQCLEQAWLVWRDLDADDPKLPPIPARLGIVKLFLELRLYTPALIVLKEIMESDDQEIEAWYLEGWCFSLMATQARESGEEIDEMTWQELATNARDALGTCQTLYEMAGEADDRLEHVKELIAELDALGIQPSPPAEEGGDDEGEWEDEEDEDVEMQ
ncbi:UPF0661 TPR repeat-containing protein C16D10.01c [Mycena kentingensis (nom. inval.)]|nr:UPF0661 TPR repeat-containing protein C16D10.01c [Mycena kentingensis (nom. inval.)]